MTGAATRAFTRGGIPRPRPPRRSGARGRPRASARTVRRGIAPRDPPRRCAHQGRAAAREGSRGPAARRRRGRGRQGRIARAALRPEDDDDGEGCEQRDRGEACSETEPRRGAVVAVRQEGRALLPSTGREERRRHGHDRGSRRRPPDRASSHRLDLSRPLRDHRVGQLGAEPGPAPSTDRTTDGTRRGSSGVVATPPRRSPERAILGASDGRNDTFVAVTPDDACRPGWGTYHG